MAQTVDAFSACDVTLAIDNNLGNLVQIEGSTNEASLAMTRQVGEAQTFEGEWSIKKGCKKSVSVSLSGLFSRIDAESMNIMKDWFFNSSGTSRSIQIDVPDSAVGSDRYTGEMIIENLNLPLSANDAAPIAWSAALSNDGAFSVATITS